MGILTDTKAFNPIENDYDQQNETTNVNVNINRKSKNKFYRRQCYYSDVVGDYILDAVTSAKYPWKVGSLDERRFFKVKDTTQRDYYDGRGPRTMFYENPYAYINHARISDLDEELIQKWYANVKKLYPGQYTNP